MPPNVRGSTSEHTELYLDALKAAYAETLTGLLSMSGGDERLVNKKMILDNSRTALEKVSKKRTMADYLLKDASRLKKFPIFKVKPGLRPLLEDMFATESLLYQILDVSATYRMPAMAAFLPRLLQQAHLMWPYNVWWMGCRLPWKKPSQCRTKMATRKICRIIVLIRLLLGHN